MLLKNTDQKLFHSFHSRVPFLHLLFVIISSSSGKVRVLNKKYFEIRINTDFEGVMRECSGPRTDESGTWISEEIIATYTALHQMGFAHSVEAYRNDKLAGGLYGVCINGVFFGESMFSAESNASKVAFHYLIQILRKNGFAYTV